MPKRKRSNYGKRSSKRRRRRTYRARRSKFTKTSGSGLNRSVFGDKKLFKTRYVETQVSIDPGLAGFPASVVYNVMSLYDPNFSGTGHQPIGFDQIMPLYQHYTVIGVRARVTLTNMDTSYAQTCILHIQPGGSPITNIPEIIENGRNRYVVLPPLGTGGSTKTMTMNFSARKFFGRKVLSDDIFRGTATTSPPEGAYLHVTVAPQNANDTTAVRATIHLEFISILTEPKVLASS